MASSPTFKAKLLAHLIRVKRYGHRVALQLQRGGRIHYCLSCSAKQHGRRSELDLNGLVTLIADANGYEAYAFGAPPRTFAVKILWAFEDDQPWRIQLYGRTYACCSRCAAVRQRYPQELELFKSMQPETRGKAIILRQQMSYPDIDLCF